MHNSIFINVTITQTNSITELLICVRVFTDNLKENKIINLMSSVKTSGYCISQCRLYPQSYDSICMGCDLPLHLICAAIISKDKGLCYDCKNIRRLEIDLSGNIVNPM